MGPGGSRYDAVELLRRKREEMKAAEDGSGAGAGEASNVVRLPKRPRRGRDDLSDAQRRPWSPEAVYDPAPTRPVTRAELQGETGAWPVDAAAQANGNAEHERNVIDLGASRRKRGGASASFGGPRPRVKPRRIGHADKELGGDTDA
ncbi:hypothetical protein [Nocardia mangyaensis]|uniref:hypothetical protein n=1 Tax=Nocardia mangyaensis TaxID=2213200 RepID=UPI00267571FA|nr:hypothetical protein [Nocardia mangyaensis]MDO3646189.1 hypothetical protein [Nocardia mangyaensis]